MANKLSSLQSFLDAPKYVDAFSQAHDIGSKYPSNPLSRSKYDKQGISSDVRHTLGSAAGKEAIIDWSSANLGIDPYGKFANVIGNVGITGATALEEIPDAWRSFKQALGEKDYSAITSGGIFAQPWEDVQANLNAWGIPYGASLKEKLTAGLPSVEEFWGGEKVGVKDKINAFRFKQQQLMNQRKQDMQQTIREHEAAEAAKQKAAADAAAERQAALQAQVTAQANKEARERVSRGEAKDYGKTETRASSGWESSPFAKGGLADLYRYGGFSG